LSAGDWKEMYQAAQDGDLELVRYHIRSGVDPNYQHPEILSTPLVCAILHSHFEVAIFLLENGADPQLQSYFDDLTPIQAAKRLKNRDLIAVIQATIESLTK
jgi:uncharacterized protein